MTIDEAFAVLKDNHKEWAERGLRMVNHNDVEEAMRCLFDNMPFEWGKAFEAWERDQGKGHQKSDTPYGIPVWPDRQGADDD